jgi:8-oxo-dGTP pyrophosphatase MutT (NUDIX family)
MNNNIHNNIHNNTYNNINNNTHNGVFHKQQTVLGQVLPGFSENKDKSKLFCINCGKIGHISKHCLCPIISIGVICIKLNIDDLDINTLISFIKKKQNNYIFSLNEINYLKKIKNKISHYFKDNTYDNLFEFLLIQRKNSLNYVEFIRGKYDINNLNYLETTMNFITEKEKEDILKYNFDTLWNNLWNKSDKNNQESLNKDNSFNSPTFEDLNFGNIPISTNHNYGYIKSKSKSSEFLEAKKKFNLLKNGFYIKKNEINLFISLEKLIGDNILSFNKPEWGFPKGRRNLKEKNIECAKREFEEETNLIENDYNILNINPIDENYTSINCLKYKHIYYVGQLKNINSKNNELIIDSENQFQFFEIGDIGWFKFKEGFNLIRDYYISKKMILYNLYLDLKYIIEHFNQLFLDLDE